MVKRSHAKKKTCPHHGPRCTKKTPLQGCGAWDDAWNWTKGAANTVASTVQDVVIPVYKGVKSAVEFIKENHIASAGLEMAGAYTMNPALISAGLAAQASGYGKRRKRQKGGGWIDDTKAKIMKVASIVSDAGYIAHRMNDPNDIEGAQAKAVWNKALGYGYHYKKPQNMIKNTTLMAHGHVSVGIPMTPSLDHRVMVAQGRHWTR